MPNFFCKINKEINGFEVKVYEVDLVDPNECSKLEDFLRKKIKSMKINRNADSFKQLFPPDISGSFADKFSKRLEEASRPKKSKITAFDVRRSWVTEFMSQLLLEKEYGCVFHESVDKRINKDITETDKHAGGIDVTGIQIKNPSGLRFVVCEVKATKDPKIPCSESEKLLNDILKGVSNTDERLSREILKYINDLGETSLDDDLLKNILDFLIRLVADFSSKDVLLNNVIFFPFLIRKNEAIIRDSNLNDFQGFTPDKLKDIDIKGIIWSFNNEIDEFCTSIYDKAVNA